MAEKAAKLDVVADALRYGNDADGRRLVIDHADSGFIGDDSRNGRRRCITGDGDHIEADGADASHGFELFKAQAAAANGFEHALVFADRNEGA